MVSRPPESPVVREFEPVSLTAWDGRVTSVLRLQGCNFRCPGCTVPHLIPRALDVGSIPLDAVFESIYRRRRWLDGVVVAGGEPTLHDGLADMLAGLRQLGLPVRLWTNGSRPDALRLVLEAGDLASVSLTLLGPLDPSYSVAAGARVRLADVYESIEMLLRDPRDHEFRVAWLDDVVEIEQMVSVVRVLAGARNVVLQPAADGRPGLRALRGVARRAGSVVDRCWIAGRPSEDHGSLARRGRRVVS